MPKKEKVGDAVANLCYNLAIGLITIQVFAGVSFLLLAPVWQLLQWLKFGSWPHLPTSLAMNYLGIRPNITTWAGTQKIITFLSSLYLPPIAAIAGILTAYITSICLRAFKATFKVRNINYQPKSKDKQDTM